MFGIGPTEMLVVGIVAVILFGSRLPSVARSLGKSIVEFKKGMSDIESDLKSSIYSEPTGRVEHKRLSQPATPKSEPATESEDQPDASAEPVAAHETPETAEVAPQ